MSWNDGRVRDMEHIDAGKLALVVGRPSTLHSPVLYDLTVHRDRHEPVGLVILELDDLMPFSGKLTQRLGFSAFCSMAVYPYLAS
jgi:hypothetical protein